MKKYKTDIQGLLILKISAFEDKRGKFYETFNFKSYKSKIIKHSFLQDNISISKKNVFRGFHGDFKTYKLTSCIFGKMRFFFIDNRNKSKTFRKIVSFEVSSKKFIQFLVPPGIGMATLTLSKVSYLSYKQTTYYNFSSQFTIKIRELNAKLKTPKKIIISKRDS
tara:strand:- start:1992 stop:2486 length:495 start_codon:yes stop_codon:yes gene_type:complete